MINIDSTTSELLEILWAGGIGHFHLLPSSVSIWHRVGSPFAPIDEYMQHCYYGVNPVRAIPTKNANDKPVSPRYVRSRLDYLENVNALFADFDCKDEIRVTDEESEAELADVIKKYPQLSDEKDIRQTAFEAVRDRKLGADPTKYMTLVILRVVKLPIKPSVLVSTGGGLQAIWLLDQPFVVQNSDDLEYAKKLQKAFAYTVGADRHAINLTGLLRLPGSVNRKYIPPREVVYKYCDLDRRYRLSELVAYAKTELDRLQESIPTPNPTPVVLTKTRLPHKKASRANRWAETCFDKQIANLAIPRKHGGNDLLNRTAITLAGLVAASWQTAVTESDAKSALERAAEICGLPKDKIRWNIDSGFRYGMSRPMSLPRCLTDNG